MSTQVAADANAAEAALDGTGSATATEVPSGVEVPTDGEAAGDGDLEADRPDRPGAPWWRSAFIGLITWAAAASMYFLVTLLSWMINDKQGPWLSRMYDYWNHWDTGHYIRIAQVGYTTDRTDTHAFFPLFPILLRALDVIVPGPTLVAALVLSNLACVGALVVLHRFALHEFDQATADRMLLFLMAWPTAFFLGAGYNESLFLLFSAGSLYLMRRGDWWTAGALGALASATRLSGALLTIAFIAEYVRQQGFGLRAARRHSGPNPSWQRGWRPRSLDIAAILLVPLGLAAFCLYSWIQLGDPWAFSHAQGEWGRELTMPWAGLVQATDTISNYPLLRPVAIHNFVDVAATAVTVLLLVECLVGPWLRRDQLPLVLYSVASFLIVLTSPVGGDFPLQGAPRYALEFIPIFFLLARVGAARSFERIYLLPAVGLQAVFLLTFINNVWVA